MPYNSRCYIILQQKWRSLEFIEVENKLNNFIKNFDQRKSCIIDEYNTIYRRLYLMQINLNTVTIPRIYQSSNTSLIFSSECHEMLS